MRTSLTTWSTLRGCVIIIIHFIQYIYIFLVFKTISTALINYIFLRVQNINSNIFIKCTICQFIIIKSIYIKNRSIKFYFWSSYTYIHTCTYIYIYIYIYDYVYVYVWAINVVYVLRRQSRDTNRNIKWSVYFQYR